jgi:hypothetical protein
MKERFWPEITDPDTARSAAMHGVFAALFVAVATGAMGLLSMTDPWPSFLDVVLSGFLGFRIWRMSRSAAVFALVYFIANKVYMVATDGLKGATAYMALALVMAFISGVRGTFAYHRYVKEAA